MRRWCVLATVTAVALVAAPSAGAQTPQLPVGQADGVRIVRVQGAIVVVFTARAERLWRSVAGKRVSVFCEETIDPNEDGFGFVVLQGGGTTMRAPRRGRRINTGDLTRGMDYCEVWLEARTIRRNGQRERRSRELIVAIPVTQQGAVHLDERARAYALMGLLHLAGIDADRRNLDHFPPPAELIQFVPALPRPVKLSVAALQSPSDTPPAGSIGYYSDGAQHVAAVVLSASGRRLFLEYDVDGVIRTNVLGYLYADE
jgi:hypothetical protein